MKSYIGTRFVKAKPMNSRCCKTDAGGSLRETELVEGFLVEQYDSDPKCEDLNTSWLTESQFNGTYREVVGLSFGMAVEALKLGKKVCRPGWNGKGMFLFLVPGSIFKVNRAPLLGIYPEGTEVNYHPHIDMKTADGTIVPWLARQTDMLADDWQLLEGAGA